ncbi:MAG: Mur ligase domain-containing protein, partial [Alphaproteobacteria bacterium]
MAATPLWHAGEVQRATGGRVPPGRAAQDWTASGVSIDSRSLEGGDLFVALKGPNFDGHDYVTVARAAGA